MLVTKDRPWGPRQTTCLGPVPPANLLSKAKSTSNLSSSHPGSYGACSARLLGRCGVWACLGCHRAAMQRTGPCAVSRSAAGQPLATSCDGSKHSHEHRVKCGARPLQHAPQNRTESPEHVPYPKLSALRSDRCCQCALQHQQLSKALLTLAEKHTSGPKYAWARAMLTANAAPPQQGAPGEPGAHTKVSLALRLACAGLWRPSKPGAGCQT